MRKLRKTWLFVALSMAILSELSLREIWGFASAPLYREDVDYEYIVQPNQDGYRFGNRYHYNSYSMRCDEPDSTKTIILGLGDSVLFGGTQTDQDSIATTIFTKETGMQMLNISAGSWGPDNCAMYLKKHGMFGAKAIFLLVSSHDAHDNIDYQKVVGEHPSYPEKQYISAWGEIIGRYLLPLFLKSIDEDPDVQVLKGIIKNGKPFNQGFYLLKQMADSANIPMYVCLHPEKSEIEMGSYNEQGKEIISWCQQNDVTIIKELDEGITQKELRDNIHLNNRGQRFEADIMKAVFKDWNI